MAWRAICSCSAGSRDSRAFVNSRRVWTRQLRMSDHSRDGGSVIIGHISNITAIAPGPAGSSSLQETERRTGRVC